MGCKFMLCEITVTWWITGSCCNMHDVHTRIPPSSPGDFNDEEIVLQQFDLIGHCGD